ncbi:MAG: fasciclin domain-containing protein [Bacteroidota bacterium]
MKKVTLSLYGLAFMLLISLSPATALAQHRSDIVETAVAAGTFNTLAAALGEADLVKTLKGKGPFTVFAPTDEAFAKLPKGTVESLLKPENRDQLVSILTYHVVKDRVRAEEVAGLRSAGTVNGQRVEIAIEDGQLFLDNARVTATDIRASNGIIHVIDEVLIPETKLIPEVAKGAKVFETLLAAVKTAGLADALSGAGPFTVFAPTDDAFAKLPAGTVEALLKPENRDQLVDILKYHVVEGRLYADDFFRRGRVNTLLDERVQVKYGDNAFRVNNANVISTDIEAGNGVIHVIDAVLLPNTGASASSEATDIIRLAIERGVPLFNQGQKAACAAIYEVAATSVLALPSVPREAKRPLTAALREIRSTHSSSRQAWILREALDSSLARLDEMMTN